MSNMDALSVIKDSLAALTAAVKDLTAVYRNRRIDTGKSPESPAISPNPTSHSLEATSSSLSAPSQSATTSAYPQSNSEEAKDKSVCMFQIGHIPPWNNNKSGIPTTQHLHVAHLKATFDSFVHINNTIALTTDNNLELVVNQILHICVESAEVLICTKHNIALSKVAGDSIFGKLQFIQENAINVNTIQWLIHEIKQQSKKQQNSSKQQNKQKRSGNQPFYQQERGGGGGGRGNCGGRQQQQQQQQPAQLQQP